ncbi:MAG: hypothetical protein KG012_20050 [Deltaproteobacteria bacterium]|nr:hypothetical protein [Deltaproteobacteria bacterium]
MILILEGEELVGSKQNRIVNVTMLIGGHNEVIIPVSCVERRRWSYKSETFCSESRMFSAFMRKNAQEDIIDSVARDRGFYPDQSRVWDGLSEKADKLGIFSSTDAMRDIYIQKEVSINEYLENFQVIPNQVGMIVLIDNRAVGLDSFGRADTLEKVFKKLVSSYALEALNVRESEGYSSRMKDLACEFMDKVKSGKVEWRPSVDLGMDGRVESDQVIGSSLVFENQLLHLAFFLKGGPGNRKPRIHRPFQR